MSLKYVSAYLLANLAGTEEPSVEQVTKIVESCGTTADKAEIEKLVSQLSGKNITETIASGKTKLFSFVATAAPAKAGKAASPAKGAAQAPEPEEEEGAAFDLFD
jgi:large subunit ribosomal protein LP2